MMRRRHPFALVMLAFVAALSSPAVRAQSYVDLPLKVDLVHDPASIPGNFFDDGCFENSNATTGSGYTGMEPDQTQDPSSPASPYFGWDTEAGGNVSRIFPSDVSVSEVWACVVAAELDILSAIYSMPPGDTFPDYDDFYSLVVNAHSWHSSAREFTAFVPPGTGRVLVRVLVGRPDEEVRGTQVLAATQTSCGQSVSYDDVLLEEHPYPALSISDGVWSRTMLAKSSLTDVTGGWRSLWFVMDTLCDGSDERVQFQVVSGYDQTRVAAIEVYAYDDADRPPVLFDESDLGEALKVNDDYDHWTDTDESDLQDGLDDLLAGDPDLALAHFDGISDDVTRAEAYLWLAGWLGSDRMLFGYDGYEWELLEDAIGLLEAAVASPDERIGFVSHHLDRARQYRRALLHERVGGVPRAVMPGIGDIDNWFRTLEDTLNDTGYYPDINVGLSNLNVAEAAWRDVAGQQIGPAWGNAHIEHHPLEFKAFVYAAINTWAHSTKNKNVSISEASLVFVKQHFDLAKEFADLDLCVDDSGATGANDGPFGRHDTLAILNHLGTWDAAAPSNNPDYDEDDEGGIVGSKWGGEGADDVHGPGETRWWDDLLAEAAAIDPASCSSANAWASQLRRFDVAYRAAHQWWAEFGAQDDEFGGGDGDDPEFVLQMLYPTLPFPGKSPDVEAVAQAVTDTWLVPWGPTSEGGTGEYYHGNNAAGATDVEHSGEYTGNGLWAMLQMRYGDPWYLEYALQSTQYLGDDVWDTGGAQAGGEPWTELLDANGGDPFGSGMTEHSDPETTGVIDYRRFVNWHMDAEGSDDNGGAAVGDLTLNGRSILPSFYVAAYNRHPGTVRLLRQWAEWWWVVLMDDGTLADGGTVTSQAKPAGVVPALVQYDTSFPYLEYGVPDGMGDPEWWKGGYGSLQEALVSCDYVYGVLLWRYLDPDTPSGERSDYLLPLYRASQLLGEYWRQTLDRSMSQQDLGPAILSMSVDTTPGSPWWTAKELSKSPAFRDVLSQQLDWLEDDAGLQNETNHANLIEYLKAGLAGKVPSTCSTCIVPPGDAYATAKFNGNASGDADKAQLEAVFADGYNWLDAFFALATTWVSYVDRIYLSNGGAHKESLASYTQGYISSSFPNTVVTWEAAPGEDPLELAVLCKGWQYDSSAMEDVWRALVVNFAAGSGDTDVLLRFRHGLAAGSYDLYAGPNDGTDAIASGQATFIDTVDIGWYGSHGVVEVAVPEDPGSCGAELVLELRDYSAPMGSLSTFADPAVSTHDFRIYVDSGDILFDLPVHNVGTADTSGVTATLAMDFYLQGPTDPPPGESTTWSSVNDEPLGPTGTVAGWDDSFTPPASVSLEDFDPIPWVWGSYTLWVRATLTLDDNGGGDKPENNEVTKIFELTNS